MTAKEETLNKSISQSHSRSFKTHLSSLEKWYAEFKETKKSA
jgi:hypothetical protein